MKYNKIWRVYLYSCLPWVPTGRYSLSGKIIDSYFIDVGSIPIVSRAFGTITSISKSIMKSLKHIYSFPSSFLYTLNPIIVEDFCDSNIDDYYYYLFWALWYTAAVTISSKVFWDYCGAYQDFLFTNHSTYDPNSPCWFKWNLDDTRPLNSWTQSSTFENGVHWTKVLGHRDGHNELFLVELPSNLATDGVIIDLVCNLSSSEPKLIAFSLVRLVMLYFSRYKAFQTQEDVVFFFKYASINFSPEANKYLSYWSQKNLRLHFNETYKEKAYELLNPEVCNPVVEIAQIWVLTYDSLYY